MQQDTDTLPQRLSREAFQALIKYRIKYNFNYYLSHPIEFLWRLRFYSLPVLGIVLVYLGCIIAAIVVFALWFICFIIDSIRAIISLLAILSDIKGLRYLHLVMRLHDFGWSAKLSFLSPLALALLLKILALLLGILGGDLGTSTLIIEGSLLFDVGWFISLSALCWFRKGTEGDNKYGPVPDDTPPIALLSPIPGRTSSWAKLKNDLVKLKNAIVKLHRKYPKTILTLLICAIIAIIPPCYYYAEHKIAVYTLEKEYDITQRDYDSALIWAAEYGSEKRVKLLIRARADVNRGNPLCEAVKAGRTEIVKLLLADPGIDNQDCETPLYKAAANGHTEIVKLLLAVPGIDVNKKGDDTPWGESQTPLYRAAERGHTEIAKLLLAAPGIDVNIANKDGETPLYGAAEHGHTEIVKLLLAAPGIDVNKGYPLRYAWRPEIIELLEAAGAKK